MRSIFSVLVELNPFFCYDWHNKRWRRQYVATESESHCVAGV